MGFALNRTQKRITTASNFDVNAAAFIAVAGITNPNQQNAINDLCIGLKLAGLFTKCIALYPMVGGNATAHSYNLINVANYQLTFNGGWTHTAFGAQGNGVNGYATTGIVPNSVMNLTSNHLSYYCRNNTLTQYDIGSSDNGGMSVNQLAIIARYTNGNAYFTCDDGYACVYSTIDSKGLNFGTVPSVGITEVYKNATLKMNSTTPANFLPSFDLYLNAANAAGTAILFSDHQCALASIGTGFNAAEESSFYTLVQNYQTTLLRQVI